MKIDDIYKDISQDVETRFHTWNHELERPLPKGKNKEVIGLMKDELGRKIMTKVVGLGAKTYSYLVDDGSENEKAKGAKKCLIKKQLKFKKYKNCFEVTQLDNKIKYLENYKIDIVLKKIKKNL